jgi:pyruvate formate lyase activating enzyme
MQDHGTPAPRAGADAERLREASFYERLDTRVRCALCPHFCQIPDGGRGACGVRVNRGGTLYTLVHDKVVGRAVEPIEKKPFFHFFPGSSAYSIATVGCNLRCAFCQNWDISQWALQNLPARIRWETDERPGPVCPQLLALESAVPGERVTPRGIVDAALDAGVPAIAYTYTEPTIFFELAWETAVRAREAGLKNLFVTNGFIAEAPLRQLAGVLDAVNVDLKSFREETYRHVSRARLQPILDAIRLYHSLGVWLEVTTLVVPGLNDSEAELRAIAEFIASVDADVPWHVSQFHPAFRMLDRPRTPLETLRLACRIGRAAGLRYVYEGNVPGEGGEDTRCPQCGLLLIQRFGFLVQSNRIQDGCCPACRTRIAGVGMSGAQVARGRAASGSARADSQRSISS